MKPKDPKVAAQRNWALCNELKNRTPLAVGVIIDQLFAYKQMYGRLPKNTDPVYNSAFWGLCDVICHTMEFKDATSVAQMLFWQEVIGDPNDRMVMGTLIRGIVARGRDRKIIPILKKVVQLGKGIGDLQMVAELEGVIMRCQLGKCT